MVTNKIWVNIVLGTLMGVKGKFLATVSFFSFMHAKQRSRSRGALHAVTLVNSTLALHRVTTPMSGLRKIVLFGVY